jgi:DNA-binding NarL/FixJ family response regulator
MRILLADDQSEVRSALHLLLEQEAGLTIVEEVSEADELLAQVEMTRPDVVLLDWELPGLQASVVVPALRAVCPHLSVIALSGLPEARDSAISADVDGFVSKGDPPERLLETVNGCRREQQRRLKGKERDNHVT